MATDFAVALRRQPPGAQRRRDQVGVAEPGHQVGQPLDLPGSASVGRTAGTGTGPPAAGCPRGRPRPLGVVPGGCGDVGAAGRQPPAGDAGGELLNRPVDGLLGPVVRAASRLLVVILTHMVRPESWSRPTGESPVRVGTGAPGSRPRFVGETRRAERGRESLFGGSKRAGRSLSESCSLDKYTRRKPSRSCHGEGHVRQARSGVRPAGPSGVRRAARAQVGRNRRGPSARPASGKDRPISRW